MLDAPGNVTGFAALLEFFEVMLSVSHMEELVFVNLNQSFCFLIGVFLVGLHCKEDHVVGLGALVAGDAVDGLVEEFFVLSEIGDDKGVVGIGAVGVSLVR